MNKYNTNLIVYADDITDARKQFRMLINLMRQYNISNPDKLIKFDLKLENDETIDIIEE